MSRLSSTVPKDKWLRQVSAERIVYDEPPVPHWKAQETYKGEGLGYRGMPAKRRPTVPLTGKQNTVAGVNTR